MRWFSPKLELENPQMVALYERYRKIFLLIGFVEFLIMLYYIGGITAQFERLNFLDGGDSWSAPLNNVLHRVTFTEETIQKDAPLALSRWTPETFNHEFVARGVDELVWSLRVEAERLGGLTLKLKTMSSEVDLFDPPGLFEVGELALMRFFRRGVFLVFLLLFIRLFLQYRGWSLLRRSSTSFDNGDHYPRG